MIDEKRLADETERSPTSTEDQVSASLETEEKKTRFLPTWVWGCGGGCLLTVALAIGGIFYLRTLLLRGLDPEVQWPKLAKALPFEERPEGLELRFGWPFLGSDFYRIYDQEKDQVVSVYYFDSGESEERREELFGSELKFHAKFIGELKDEGLSVVRIGSRDRQVRRAFQSKVHLNVHDSENMRLISGESAFVDVTPEEDPGFVLVMFMAITSDGLIADEDLVSFFEDFLVD